MNVAYFPFTYIAEQTARLLSALVGPVTVYQPVKSFVAPELDELTSRGLIEIRTPLTDGDDRLRIALAEFSEWARLNPGRSTAGSDFIGARQGEIPFFDETTVNRIRSDIRQFGQPGQPPEESDADFSARLFLALAQENDRAVDSLDQDLDRFKAMEKEFLEILEDAGDAGFSRQATGGALWREDPGSRLTAQRLRAWARLAAADYRHPEVLVTTSPAVVDLLLDNAGEAGAFEKLADVRVDISGDREEPLLERVLSGLLDGSLALTADLAEAGLPPANAEASVRISLHATANLPSGAFVEGLATSIPMKAAAKTAGHTLVVLVEG